MSAQKSSYLRSALIGGVLGNTVYTPAATVYLALFTSDPTIDDTGTEVTGGSYARQAISWGAEANGILANDTAIAFSTLPAATITHWGIYDASISGNLLYFGVFDFPITTYAGDLLTVAVGNLTVREE